MHAPPLGAVGVEHDDVAVGGGGGAARGRQPEPVARAHDGPAGAGVGPGHGAGDGVTGPVGGIAEAAAAVEEDVAAVGRAQEAGGLDERAVGVGAVEDGRRLAQGRHAVRRRHLLQHDGRRVEGRVSAAAGPARAQAVAVDLVDDVAAAAVGVVAEAGRVDGAAARRRPAAAARERPALRRRVRPQHRAGRRRPDRVERLVRRQLRAVVHDVGAVVEARDRRRPGEAARRPGRRPRQQVDVLEQPPRALRRRRLRRLHPPPVPLRRERVPLPVLVPKDRRVREVRVQHRVGPTPTAEVGTPEQHLVRPGQAGHDVVSEKEQQQGREDGRRRMCHGGWLASWQWVLLSN